MSMRAGRPASMRAGRPANVHCVVFPGRRIVGYGQFGPESQISTAAALICAHSSIPG